MSVLTPRGVRPMAEVRVLRGPNPIRVVVVAHHALVGDAVRMALSSRGIVATGASLGRGSQRELVALARVVSSVRPALGLVLCDVDDPVQLRETVLLARGVPIRWLLLTSSQDDSRWGAAVEAGVHGVVPMSEGIDVVAHAVRVIARGREGLSSDTRTRVLQAWRRAGREHRQLVERFGGLTPREMKVLSLLAEGLTVKQIAERSEVAEGTVRSQVKSVLRKLGVNSQLAAVAAHRRVVTQATPFRQRP